MHVSTPPIVISTRPLPQAQQTVQQLQAAGWRAVALPTLQIRPLAQPAAQQALWNALANLTEYDLLIWVSPNAILACLENIPRLFQDWPAQTLTPAVAVMGHGSLQTLQKAGLPTYVPVYLPHPQRENAPTQRLDSESLWETLCQVHGASWDGKKVLLLRGQGGREWLLERLIAAGASCQVVCCYQRICPQLTPTQSQMLTHYVESRQSILWSLTSSQGARNLQSMLHAHRQLWQWACQQTAVVPHPRIAKIAQLLGFIDIQIGAAGAAGLLDYLQHHYPLQSA